VVTTTFAQPNSQPQVLNLAATSWCPYVCEDKNHPGFIVDYMQNLLAQQNIELKVTILPWSRAIKESRAGKFDGLLTAVHSEAKEFKFPRMPTGYYQDCLFGRSDSEIEFNSRESFKGVRVGGVKDYGYGSPIGELFSDPKPEESIYLVSSNRPMDQLTGMLQKNRIDLIAGDKNVMEHYQNSKNEQPILSVAGCLEEIPFYTAISPATEAPNNLVEHLEKALAAKNAQALYHQAKGTLVTTLEGDL
jgi:polar amino acid transport system substrate-binding protein